MKRSESAKTTLSMYATKAGKYQKWIGMVNVLLLLSSLVLLFTGIILRLNYFMDNLGFISVYFVCLPISLIVLGIVLFIVAALGFIFAGVESKPALFGYAVVMAFISLFQIATIFFIMESRTIIVNGNILVSGAEALNQYYEYPDSAFRRQWDGIHQRLRCCGFTTYNDHINYARNRSDPCVPDSCCTEVNLETGECSRRSEILGDCPKLRGSGGRQIATVCDVIFAQGCLQILKNVYQRELEVQLLIFGLFDVIVVLLEIVSCAMAAAYVAQITRRQKAYYWNDPSAGGHRDQTMQMSRVADADLDQ